MYIPTCNWPCSQVKINGKSWGGRGNTANFFIIIQPLFVYPRDCFFCTVIKWLSPFSLPFPPFSLLPSLPSPSGAKQDAQVHSISVKGVFTFIQRPVEWWYIHCVYSGSLATNTCLYTVHRRGRPNTLCVLIGCCPHSQALLHGNQKRKSIYCENPSSG